MVYYMGGSHSHNKSAKNEKASHSSSTYHRSKLGRNGMSTVSPKIQPLGDRVVVKALARETVTKSGLVLPDTAKEKHQQGEVLAVAPPNALPNSNPTTPQVNVVTR